MDQQIAQAGLDQWPTYLSLNEELDVHVHEFQEWFKLDGVGPERDQCPVDGLAHLHPQGIDLGLMDAYTLQQRGLWPKQLLHKKLQVQGKLCMGTCMHMSMYIVHC